MRGATQKNELHTSQGTEQPTPDLSLVIIEVEPAKNRSQLVRYSFIPGQEIDD